MRTYYRFRSVNSLLGEFEELENQSIYFASPTELNDPSDGSINPHFDGDRTLWSNFLRCYALNFVDAALVSTIVGDEGLDIVAEGDLLSSAEIRQGRSSGVPRLVEAALFDSGKKPGELFTRFLVAIPGPIPEETVTGLLVLFQVLVFEACLDVFESEGMSVFVDRSGNPTARAAFDPENPIDTLQILESVVTTLEGPGAKKVQPETAIPIIVSVIRGIFKSISVGHSVAFKDRGPLIHFLLHDYTETFCERFRKTFVEFSWFAACFCREPTSTLMWSHYGDQHRGVALVFDALEDETGPFLDLERAVGVSARKGHPSRVHRRRTKMRFRDISYTTVRPPFDLFSHMGRCPMPMMLEDWLRDAGGGESQRLRAILDDVDQWRKRLWRDLIDATFIKAPAWSYEREARLVYHSIADPLLLEPENRVAVYSFESLKGIIFGARIRKDDRDRILQIIQEKLKANSRSTFHVQQAVLDASNGGVRLEQLQLFGSAGADDQES